MDFKVTRGLLLLAGLFFSITAVAKPIQTDETASLINQRLSYMKDVAGYKANNHLAIEDLPQEANVLANSVREAEALGLDGKSVAPFIQAQMDAAKAIQYRYRADWLSAPENGWQPESLDSVRAKISRLNTQILTSVSNKLKKGERFNDRFVFMKSLEQTHLKVGDKERLWQSLQRIALKR